MMKWEENDEWSEILEKSIFLSNLFLKEFKEIYKKFKKCTDTTKYSTKHKENDKCSAILENGIFIKKFCFWKNVKKLW